MWLKQNIDPMKYLDLFLHVGGKNPTNLPLTPTWGFNQIRFQAASFNLTLG